MALHTVFTGEALATATCVLEHKCFCRNTHSGQTLTKVLRGRNGPLSITAEGPPPQTHFTKLSGKQKLAQPDSIKKPLMTLAASTKTSRFMFKKI